MPKTLCQALTTTPREYLTDLTIDGCILSVKVLTNFLNAHRKGLKYLVLRNVQCKDADFVLGLLKSFSSDFELTRLALDSLVEQQWTFTVVHPNQLHAQSKL